MRLIAPVGKGPAKKWKTYWSAIHLWKEWHEGQRKHAQKDSGSNPSVVSRDVLEDTAIGAGGSGTKKPSWFKQEYMDNNPPQDPLQRDIREWSNSAENGQGHNQPKGKGKDKGKRKRSGTGSRNQDQTGSRDEETGQATLGDFGLKRQRVEFVGDVQENDDFETPRVDQAADVFCVQKCKRNCQVRRREFFSSMQRSEEPAGTHEKRDPSTGEVLLAVGCRDDRPIVDSGSVVSTCPVDYATSVPTEKIHYTMNLESVLGESLQHHGIKRNVLFTNRTGSTVNVNF